MARTVCRGLGAAYPLLGPVEAVGAVYGIGEDDHTCIWISQNFEPIAFIDACRVPQPHADVGFLSALVTYGALVRARAHFISLLLCAVRDRADSGAGLRPRGNEVILLEDIRRGEQSRVRTSCPRGLGRQ